MTILELFQLLRIPKSKWPTPQEQIVQEFPLSNELNEVVSKDTKEVGRIKLVYDWLAADASTRMNVAEYRDFWNTCRHEEKIHLGLMASKDLGIKIKEDADDAK